MKDLRDRKDLTIHDVNPIRDETNTGRRHSLRDSTEVNYIEPIQNTELPLHVDSETTLVHAAHGSRLYAFSSTPPMYTHLTITLNPEPWTLDRRPRTLLGAVYYSQNASHCYLTTPEPCKWFPKVNSPSKTAVFENQMRLVWRCQRSYPFPAVWRGTIEEIGNNLLLTHNGPLLSVCTKVGTNTSFQKSSPQGPPQASDAPAKFTSVACLP